MLCQPGHLGSGRACLSLEHIQQQVYGQALIVQVECNGSAARFLCTASAQPPGCSSDQLTFDPSVQLAGPAALLLGYQQGLCPGSVRAVTSKVLTAAAVKVLVPEALLHSPVPAARLQQRLIQQHCTLHLSSTVSCEVVSISPAGPPGTVYRVVPSTGVQLVSRVQGHTAGSIELTQAVAEDAQPAAAAAAEAQRRAAQGAQGSAGRSDAPTGAASSSSPSQGRSDRAAAAGSSGGSSSKKKKKGSSKKSPAGAIAASSSMFDALDSLGSE